eukprot:CAMPEP_0113850596 /NCGR_PEP_ID=MMETSP0372-20130328/4003_1 /TAXON_ID=340204 /ORGANISM="Lankesteria abbotti" /LENGTH=95 /DNA_ID=CAMNT_0000820973 /DNA_START=161 /DNA_END=448 /DNA_ORIENTATION=+ /assembly_acc=CAM_ASM_000359
MKTDESSAPKELVGTFNNETKEWTCDLRDDMTLRVMKFKGVEYVDIRKTWNGRPTQKGVCLPMEVFRSIQQWKGLDDAVATVRDGGAAGSSTSIG